MPTSNANGNRIAAYGTTWCPQCRLTRAVLEQRQMGYQWIDIEQDPTAAETVLRLNGGYRTVPTILLSGGRVLVEPSRRELERALTESATAA